MKNLHFPIYLVLLAALTGCAGMNFSASWSYNMPAVACQANALLCANPTIVTTTTVSSTTTTTQGAGK